MAWANVQNTGAFTAAAGTTQAKAFVSNVTVGSLIAVFCVWTSTTATCAVTDNLGNTYTPIPGSLATSVGFGGRGQWFWAPVTTGGACTVTMTVSASVGDRELYIHEFSGLDTASQPDASNAATGTGSNPTSSLTTVGNPTLLLAGAASSAGTLTPGAGYTVGFAQNGDTTQYKNATPAGATSVPFVDASSGNWLISMASFKESGAVAVRAPRRARMLTARAPQRAMAAYR